jgi:hypothetical protein
MERSSNRGLQIGAVKRHGNYKVLCGGKIFVHPARPWWWLLDIYMVAIGVAFVIEYDEKIILSLYGTTYNNPYVR